MRALQRAVSTLYPDQCALCREIVERPGALCPACWRGVQFVYGHACDACGAPLPGESDGVTDHCDACRQIVRPWSQGRAAFVYRDAGRRFVLALKHGDRPDLAGTAAGWLADKVTPLLDPDAVIVPVPVHWTRLLRRRYNQSAEIVRALGQRLDLSAVPDALVRTRATAVQDGLDPEARFRNQAGAMALRPNRGSLVAGRQVVLIDDVMTSGATLSAAADVCLAAGARQVVVAVLARAVRST